MDIIVDTNLIKSENFLRSKKIDVLKDYLKKTNSKIVLSQIVKEESISLYKRELNDKLDKINNKLEDLSKYCFSTNIVSIYIDVDKEVAAYSEHIENLKNDNILYEISYTYDFLPEIVDRANNRIRPSKNGEEFRDIILWLTIKKLLKEREMISVGFISNDLKAFASEDKEHLHPDLIKELDNENLNLIYYKNLDGFIEKHKTKVDYINREWIELELGNIDIDHLITGYVIKQLETKIEGIAYAYPLNISVSFHKFYLYEMTNQVIYLFLEFEVYVDIEMGYEYGAIGRFTKIKFYPEISVKVIDKKIEEKELELSNLKFSL